MMRRAKIIKQNSRIQRAVVDSRAVNFNWPRVRVRCPTRLLIFFWPSVSPRPPEGNEISSHSERCGEAYGIHVDQWGKSGMEIKSHHLLRPSGSLEFPDRINSNS